MTAGRGMEARFVTGLQDDAPALDEGLVPDAILVDGQVARASVIIGLPDDGPLEGK